jgi:hypothetical protein
MIGRDLDFDLHNAIQVLIAEGLLEENSDPHRLARIVIHDGYDSSLLHNRPSTTLSSLRRWEASRRN